METPPPPAPRPGYWIAMFGLVLLGGGAAVWFFLLRDDGATPPSVRSPVVADTTPPADPRLAFATEFKNVHPDAKYVGDAACAKCHRGIDKSYHQHPMGRSAAVKASGDGLEKYDAAAHNPTKTPTHQLSVLENGGRHRVSAADPAAASLPPYEQAVDVVIGSGTRGRSYLTVDRGSVWQTPISWFTDDNRWNVSPGFDLGEGGRRAIRGECLFCHVDRTDPVPKSFNLYKQVLVGQASIGCERCHGPGEKHVELHRNGGKTGRDDTIVNPKHLSQQLQMDICRQCHLLGEQRVVRRGREVFEFRPGLPLDRFLSTFVRHPDLADNQRSVGQFEQMEKSGCFTRGSGTMTCTSCHDPHLSPAAADKPAFYRAKCLTCHEKQGCKEAEPVRLAKENNCVACHMPKRGSTSIAHAAVTDHLIPRRGDVIPPARKSVEPLPGILPIVPYRTGPHAPSAEERDRDLGVALSYQLAKMSGDNPAVARSVARTAVAKLTAAVERWPTDDVAWVRLASVYGTLGDNVKRLEATRKAAELAPDSEIAVAARAKAEGSGGDPAKALELTDQLIRLNPASVEYRLVRASLLMARKEWDAADVACREAISINPISAEAHVIRAMALNGGGKTDEARKAADIAFALETNAEVRKQYRQWLGGVK